MKGIIVLILFVYATNADPNPGVISDVLEATGNLGGKVAGKAIETMVGGAFDIFMDVSKFTMEMAQKYFAVFKQENNKTYASSEEEQKRLKIFFSNYIVILTHNKAFKDENSTFNMGVTPFADLTEEEFVNDVCNCFEAGSPSNETSNETDTSYQAGGAVPQSIDWRQLGAVTSVKQQYQCGSCWTFAAVGAIEGAQYIATKELKDLSMQNLLDCASELGQGGNCQGGHHKVGFEYAKRRQGINLLADYPYENGKKSCRYSPQKMKKGFVKSAHQVLPPNNEEALKRAVATRPVAVGINSKGLQLFRSSGVYYNPQICGPGSNPDHAVLVVGYGTTPQKEDYWIIKNSWGPTWGENGFFKLARNRNNHCNVAFDAWYPIV